MALDDLQPGTPHVRCRREAPADYPPRANTPDDQVLWSVPSPQYHPVEFTSQHILDMDRTVNPKGYADPPDPLKARETRPFTSLEGEVLDSRGLPLNPRGRTGIAGRGRLGKWGANPAGDALVTRIRDGKLHMIVVQRADSHQWALPGGMVDAGEEPVRTQSRELEEETGVHIDFHPAIVVYRGYCDDRRNTDQAWMETTVAHVHTDDDSIHPRVIDPKECAAAEWQPVTTENVGRLYGSHPHFVLQAVREWEKRTGHVVGTDGSIGRAGFQP